MCNYEWRFCPICSQRIFADEEEGDTIKTVGGILYCIDCAGDVEEENKKNTQHSCHYA